jgi:hypothetical protein
MRLIHTSDLHFGERFLTTDAVGHLSNQTWMTITTNDK